MAFTDIQLELFDQQENMRISRRDTPLDEHPQLWYDKHHVVKLTTTLGCEYYLHNPGEHSVWTHDRSGAYRYSDTKFGVMTRDCDAQQGHSNMIERGVDGKITIETVN